MTIRRLSAYLFTLVLAAQTASAGAQERSDDDAQYRESDNPEMEAALSAAEQTGLTRRLTEILEPLISDSRYTERLQHIIDVPPADRQTLALQVQLLEHALREMPTHRGFIDLALDRAPELAADCPPALVIERVRERLKRPASFSQQQAIFTLLGTVWAEAPTLRSELVALAEKSEDENSEDNEAVMLRSALLSERYKNAAYRSEIQKSPPYIETLDAMISMLGRSQRGRALYQRYYPRLHDCLWAINPSAVRFRGFTEGARRLLFEYETYPAGRSCAASTPIYTAEWTMLLVRTPMVDSSDRNRRLIFLEQLGADLMPHLKTLSRPDDPEYESALFKQQLTYLKTHGDDDRRARDCRIILPRLQSLIEAGGDAGGPFYRFSSAASLTRACSDEWVDFLASASEPTMAAVYSFLPYLRNHLTGADARRFDAAVEGSCDRLKSAPVCIISDLYRYDRSEGRRIHLKQALERAATLKAPQRAVVFRWILSTMIDRIPRSSREKLAEELIETAKTLSNRTPALDREIAALAEQLRKYEPFIFSM